MLGKKNKQEKTPLSTNTDGTSTIIPDCVITGTFSSNGNIRLDGTVDGKIVCKGKVVVGVSGKVIGDIECTDADISGTVIGNIAANAIVTLNKGGEVQGDIAAEHVKMDLGARFIGRSLMKTEELKLNIPQIESIESERIEG